VARELGCADGQSALFGRKSASLPVSLFPKLVPGDAAAARKLREPATG